MKYLYIIVVIFAFQITNAQVGIGTTTPKALLDITASSSASPITTDGLLIPRVLAFPSPVGIAQNGMMVFLTTTFAGNKVGLYYYDFPSLTWKWMTTGNNGNIWQYNNANARIDLPFQSDGTTARPIGNEAVILDNGNVGFGTLNPARHFQVSRDFDNGTKFAVSNPNAGINAFSQITAETTGATSYLYSINNGYPFNPSFPWFTASNSLLQGTGVGGLSLGATNSLGYMNFFTGGNDESMRITPTGNVGIGTKTPSEKLTVENGDFQLGESIGTTAVGRKLYFSNINSNNDPIYFQRENVGTDRSNLNLFLGDNFGNGASFGERFNILTINSPNVLFTVNAFNGNVGVNAATPSEKLEVVGNIRYSGALMPNNQAGTSGQILTSAGAGVPPTWNSSAVVTANEWHTTGNATTVDGTNFIGTTDNIPLNFRVNNQKSGRIASTGETFFGFEAGKNNQNLANDRNNSAFGYRAFTANATTTARDNTAIGQTALTANNGGSFNTALGSGALKSNVGTSYNTALGKDALTSNTADYNTAIGWESLVNNTSGTRNIGLGIRPLRYYAAISDNIAIGYEAMVGSATIANNTGNNNTAVGNFSINANTSGTENVAIGNDALKSNNIGSQNTAIGYQAMLANTAGIENTAVGRKSLVTNTTGNQNTAIGFNALFVNNGSNNTAVGRNAMFNNTSGSNNAALGWNSMFTNSTGSSNTGIGYGSLYFNNTGNQNAALGEGALYRNVAGSANAAIGFNALYNNLASNNSAFGYQAMFRNTTGTFNTSVGKNSLYTNTLGDYNVAIGNNAMNLNLSGSSNTAIGYSSLATNSVGINNTATGRNSLNDNTANNNTANGHTSLFKNTSGTNNVGFGYQALYQNLVGANNTAIGTNSLENNLGSDNIGIGYNADVPSNSSSNQLSIGNVIYGTTMSTTALGKIGIGEAAPAYKLQVKGDIASTDGVYARSLYNVGMSTTSVFVDNIEPWTDNGIKFYDGNSNSHLNLEARGYSLLQSYGVSGSAKGLLENANTSDLILQNIGSNVGIGLINPSEKLHVVGNIRLSGAIMPNNLPGTSGQVLVSAGAGVAPTWDSNPIKPIFKTTAIGVYNVLLSDYTIRINPVSSTSINLPNPIGNTGKIFVIIGLNGLASTPFTVTGGSLILDETLAVPTISSINSGERYTLQSDGINWIVIDR